MKITAFALRAIFVVVFAFSITPTSLAQERTPPPPPRPENSSNPPKMIRKSGGVLQDTAIKRVLPQYPDTAKEARVSGSVVVEVTVDEEGNVSAARAVSGHPLLRDAAVEAARAWTFTPTQLNGVPVKVIGTIVFNFTPPHDPALLLEAESIKEKLRAKPGSADLYLQLGDIFNKLGDHNDAAEAYRQAVRFDEKLIPARVALILTYARLGDKESAMIEHAKLKVIDPEAAEAILKEIEK